MTDVAHAHDHAHHAPAAADRLAPPDRAGLAARPLGDADRLRPRHRPARACIRWARALGPALEGLGARHRRARHDAALLPDRPRRLRLLGATTSPAARRGPDDHSGHGAHSWQDYFRINTDHKVIGIQYLVTTFVFFCIGGLLAMLFRAELAQPGDQFFNPQTFNGLVSNARGADDLPLHHPGVRRARRTS